MLTGGDVVKAYSRIEKSVHMTPIFTCGQFDKLTGRKLFFKAENLQKTGSFKARGALNALSVLLENHAEKVKLCGVVTHSSGNHGQALAYAAQKHGIPCTVVAPKSAPKAKIEAMQHYGAEIVLCENNMQSRELTCAEIVSSRGAFLIHPHDDLSVMAGQGTIALEFFEQVPELDAILVAVGGGGLLSGIATYTKYLNPKCRVYAVEPVGKNLAQTLKTGTESETDHFAFLPTVADGIRVRCLGRHCLPVALEHCEKSVFSVTDDQIERATRLIFERMKLVVETSGAVCLAAALSPEFFTLPGDIRNIGIVLCGGNIDLDYFFHTRTVEKCIQNR